MPALHEPVEALRWLRFAREDLATATAILERGDMAPRHACWLAQQAAEKAIKAILVYLQIEFPRSHDLDALRNRIPVDWETPQAHPDLAALTEWAVEARYPGHWSEPVSGDAQMAVEQAGAVWHSVCSDLARHGLDMTAIQ